MRGASATLLIGLCGGVLGGVPAQGAVRSTWKERIAPYRAAVLGEAGANAAAVGNARIGGDRLADRYLQVAAGVLRARAADRDTPEAIRGEVQAFCVAMGILMDRTGALATNPMARLALGEVEPAKDRAGRRKLLGDPTLRGRGDWLRHFWVSAALRALIGRGLAEHAGVSKELADAGTASGFSLADLCANVAGMELAERLLAPDTETDPVLARLKPLSELSLHTRWMPDAKDLPEGLNADEAAKRFGTAGSPAMTKTLADLRALVRTAAGYAPATASAVAGPGKK